MMEGGNAVFEVSYLLAQSNVVQGAGSARRGHSLAAVTAWLLAAVIAAVYLALSILALKSPIPDEWQFVTGPTTWTGLSSMTAVVFVVVGGALTVSQWTRARGARRRYRTRQGRLLDV
ncbi:MAG: hypothetical protein ACKVVP_06895 [Chloroflexota bacterium]